MAISNSSPRITPADSSANSEQHIFCEHLNHDASAAGAERGAHGQLTLPQNAASQQKTGHVGARNQQHCKHGG